MEAYQHQPRGNTHIVVNAFILLVAAVFIWYVYTYWVQPAINPPDKGDSGGYDDTNLEVNNTPGMNPEAITDGVNNFSNGNLVGYACLRCSDNGANDAMDYRVSYQCSPQETTAWGRSDTVVNDQSTNKIAVGNLIFTGKMGEDEDFSMCRKVCEEINDKKFGDLGPCEAVTYDKTTHSCSFFWNCDKVKKSSGDETLLMNFNVNKQPEVII